MKFDFCLQNIKKTCSSMNKILKPNGSLNKSFDNKVNGICVSDPIKVANEFNKQYVTDMTVAGKLASTIQITNDPTRHVHQLCNSFGLFPTNPNKIQNVICGFKSKGSHI